VDVTTTDLSRVLVFTPTPHRDERGFFTRTFDADVAEHHGVPGRYAQESQSRSGRHVLRGLHGRSGDGEAKLIRCARGAVHLVVVDARSGSRTLGQHITVPVDDESLRAVFVPAGMLVGFQVLSDLADVCYKIERPHDPEEDLSVRYDDPELGIAWPHRPTELSRRDQRSGSWTDLLRGRALPEASA
jgi:dTDP-4-dehydrorhamnose 3,5-epimerase